MNTTTFEAGAAAPGRSRLTIGLWWLTLAIGLYFVATNVPRYLTIDEARYGPYFWPRAGYLVPHLLAGVVAIVLGPLQFWPRIRTGYPRCIESLGASTCRRSSLARWRAWGSR